MHVPKGTPKLWYTSNRYQSPLTKEKERKEACHPCAVHKNAWAAFATQTLLIFICDIYFKYSFGVIWWGIVLQRKIIWEENIMTLCTCIHRNITRLHLIIRSPCAYLCAFFKVGNLAQLAKALAGELPEVAVSNRGGSMTKYVHIYNGCWYLFHAWAAVITIILLCYIQGAVCASRYVWRVLLYPDLYTMDTLAPPGAAVLTKFLVIQSRLQDPFNL